MRDSVVGCRLAALDQSLDVNGKVGEGERGGSEGFQTVSFEKIRKMIERAERLCNKARSRERVCWGEKKTIES